MPSRAIITGHSRGLGRALDAALRASGWEVLGISRTPTTGGVALDLSDPATLTSWLATGRLADFLKDADRVLLINNAGTLAPVALVGDASPGDIAQAVNLNVTAALVLTGAVLRARPADVRTQIVHISSGAARRGYPAWSTYCATKAALDLHASALAAENQPGVRVVSVAPGVVDTAMQASIRAAEAFPLRDQFVALSDEGRLSSPEEAAAQILALIESPNFGEPVITDVRH